MRYISEKEYHAIGNDEHQAMVVFPDKDAIYLLDEPENSLSIKFQIDLAKYIKKRNKKMSDIKKLINNENDNIV